MAIQFQPQRMRMWASLSRPTLPIIHPDSPFWWRVCRRQPALPSRFDFPAYFSLTTDHAIKPSALRDAISYLLSPTLASGTFLRHITAMYHETVIGDPRPMLIFPFEAHRLRLNDAIDRIVADCAGWF